MQGSALPGVTVQVSDSREYHTAAAAQVLGRVAVIGPEEYEEKKKQNTQSEYGANIQSDYGPKPFTNNQNNSIFKMTGSPNKNLRATANMYNNQIVKNNYDNPTVKKGADYLNNPQTVKQNTATNSNYNQIITKEKN